MDFTRGSSDEGLTSSCNWTALGIRTNDGRVRFEFRGFRLPAPESALVAPQTTGSPSGNLSGCGAHALKPSLSIWNDRACARSGDARQVKRGNGVILEAGKVYRSRRGERVLVTAVENTGPRPVHFIVLDGPYKGVGRRDGSPDDRWASDRTSQSSFRRSSQ